MPAMCQTLWIQYYVEHQKVQPLWCLEISISWNINSPTKKGMFGEQMRSWQYKTEQWNFQERDWTKKLKTVEKRENSIEKIRHFIEPSQVF